MGGWTQFLIAGVLVFFVIRLWPQAKHWISNGPKGSSNDWTTFIVLMAGIALLVALMIMSVRGG